MKLTTPKLPELAFIVYACLIIIVLEIYKTGDVEISSKDLISNVTPTDFFTQTNEEIGPPPLGYLPRSIWKQANYGGQTVTPIPGTTQIDPIEFSYSQAQEIQLANPFIREEASLPIEGNIGMRIDIATEIFGPFERTFLL
tara:strand:+ start:1516 stop:1938 length:423 start_codon:yes stop_codon:yes gene_type:complete